MNWITASIDIPQKPLLKLNEVASLIDRDESTIKEWLATGTFPAPKKVCNGKPVWTARSIGVWMAWQDYVPESEKTKKSTDSET